MFQANKPVAIKVLHRDYSILACQEADCLRNLNGQDPEMYSPVLRIYVSTSSSNKVFLQPKNLVLDWFDISNCDPI